MFSGLVRVDFTNANLVVVVLLHLGPFIRCGTTQRSILASSPVQERSEENIRGGGIFVQLSSVS